MLYSREFMEAVQAKLVARKSQELLIWYQVPMDFLVVVWAKPIVKVEQNSYLKITQVTDEVQKNLELRQIEQCILNSKKSKVKKLLAFDVIKIGWIALQRYTLVVLLNTWNNDKRLESKLENVMKEKLYITQSIAATKVPLQAWDTKYLNYCPDAPVYTTSVFLKLLTGGKKLGMYEPEFYYPTARERELCPWYLELWRQMPSSHFELDLYIECHPAPTTQNVRRQLHSEGVQENVRETSQHFIRRHTNVHPLSLTGSVGNVEIIIEDYFQLSNNRMMTLDWLSLHQATYSQTSQSKRKE
ncbi:hypothetical protein SELMODRAFT_405897 [Selaginella moellendorffii]|uniref:Uncharacterized protein n=1 Tax=Selaginella moellendorffii TaxID=88036 RepID=D8R012_SELML|nr:hypothetical protein SELMODRAFT_405897 [Selaginella moellendorffii]